MVSTWGEGVRLDEGWGVEANPQSTTRHGRSLRGQQTVQSVRNPLQVGEWAASIDLKDGYILVSAHNSVWTLLMCIRN